MTITHASSGLHGYSYSYRGLHTQGKAIIHKGNNSNVLSWYCTDMFDYHIGANNSFAFTMYELFPLSTKYHVDNTCSYKNDVEKE